MDTLTEYERRQVAEIAAWKAEVPGRVSRALKRVRAPLGRLVGKAVPGPMVRNLAEQAEALIGRRDGPDAAAASAASAAREAGVGDVEELRYGTLEECDRRAREVSARAERAALAEGAVAGLGGIVTELGNIPVLLAAAVRAIRRIGHCYGYRLDTEAERRFVLGVLELSAVDDPAHRHRLRERLSVGPPVGSGLPPAPGLNGVKKQLVDDLLLEAVPLLGDPISIALDYAFIRRVDVTARRVFQERWLRDRGKLTRISPADSDTGSVRRTDTGRAARDLAAEAVYLGGYGVGFLAAAPLAAAATLASRLPVPVVRGASDGARAAASSAHEFAAGWRSLTEPEPGPDPEPGPSPSPSPQPA